MKTIHSLQTPSAKFLYKETPDAYESVRTKNPANIVGRGIGTVPKAVASSVNYVLDKGVNTAQAISGRIPVLAKPLVYTEQAVRHVLKTPGNLVKGTFGMKEKSGREQKDEKYYSKVIENREGRKEKRAHRRIEKRANKANKQVQSAQKEAESAQKKVEKTPEPENA